MIFGGLLFLYNIPDGPPHAPEAHLTAAEPPSCWHSAFTSLGALGRALTRGPCPLPPIGGPPPESPEFPDYPDYPAQRASPCSARRACARVTERELRGLGGMCYSFAFF